MIKLAVRIETGAARSLREYSRKGVPDDRRDFVDRQLREALQRIIMDNPVETGRSRAGWVECLEQLGVEPPPGWQGADAGAMSQGRRQARLQREESTDVSSLSAANGVDYVPFLEYGTRQMSPFAMVRRALGALVRSQR